MSDVVQTASSTPTTTGSVTTTITSVASGNSLIAVVQYEDGDVLTAGSGAVTSSGDTWVSGFRPSAGGNGEGIGYWYIASASSGTHAITFTNPGTTAFYNNLLVFETVPITGVDQTASVAPALYNNAINSGTTSATTQNDEIAIAAMHLDFAAPTGVSDPATSGYTSAQVHDTTSNRVDQTSWKTLTSTGTQIANWTFTAGSPREGVAAIVTFKKAAAAAGIAAIGGASASGGGAGTSAVGSGG